MSAHILKLERIQINNLVMHLELWKKEEADPKVVHRNKL
jgi:hypothetical protein